MGQAVVNLTNHFLIAMPGMADPNFSRTLTLMCEHSDKGALGIVVNRPTELTLGKLFEQVDIPLTSQIVSSMPVYFGGPVQSDRGFVLHRPAKNFQSTLKVSEDIGLTTSKDILEALGEGGDATNHLITLGYAGWAPGQLEAEILRNGWLTVAADAKVIFDLPAEERYDAALKMLGLDHAKLSSVAGHA